MKLKLKSKRFTTTSISLVAAFMMLAVSMVFKGTAYENAWLYIFGAWVVIIALIEFAYFRKEL